MYLQQSPTHFDIHAKDMHMSALESKITTKDGPICLIKVCSALNLYLVRQ